MFADREEAGRLLGEHLRERGDAVSIVLGLPRGGVPVAAEVAAVLGVPLDVLLVRKLGLPSFPEVAMGAIGERGVRVVDASTIARAGVTADEVAAVERRERAVLDERARLLRRGPPPGLEGDAVVIVDDGIATGATATAACLVARSLGARSVLVAAPVGAPDAARRIEGADAVVCLEQPFAFRAVGDHYRSFAQTTEAEVLAALERSRPR
ncbi:phosphoribosyltransferase [Agrococcus sediminis]|uniref:phosphoribosyltransferase n=1 Tax=Agrococcus sediminis TaxID=2599924 RepID=UPI003430E194